MACARLVAFVRNRLSPLLRDSAGSMLPLAAGGLIVILALVGGGVDFSRVYKTQNRLQAACDAAVLAGRKAVTTNGLDATASDQATRFFNSNFDSTLEQVTNVSFTPSSTDNGATVVGSASASVPMKVMSIFGMRPITVNATCQAVQGVSNLDVTFVFDTTGSMGTILSGSSTRLDSLKSAAKSFFTTIQTSTNGTTARVRYAFVPFSENVNVGGLLYALNPSYLINQWTVQSRVPQFDTYTYARFNNSTNTSNNVPWIEYVYASSGFNSATSSGTTTYADLPACQAAEPADTGWVNSGSSSTNDTNNYSLNSGWRTVTQRRVSQPQTQTYYFCNRSGDDYVISSYTATRSFNTYSYIFSGSALTPTTITSATTTFDHWDYRPVLYDLSTYKTGAAINIPVGSSGANVSTTWNGCIEERYTNSSATFSFNSTTNRITPTTSLDLDIDRLPTSDATDWIPALPAAAYYRTDSSGNLTNSLVSTNGGSAGGNCPTGATTLQTMTQTAFNTYVDALVAQGNTYHDLGMLWAARISSPSGPWSTLVNTAPTNNQSVSRHLILETDGEPNAAYSRYTMYGLEFHDRRVTDDGYTDQNVRHPLRFRALCDAIKAKGIRIWVVALATNLTSDLTYCASPNSSYTATSSSQLTAAFQSIAKQVGELRISQ